MNNIQPEKDSAIVIEKFKSGDVPPGDFNFEDMQDPHSMLTADALANTGPSNLNLYPRKKELERQMARIEAELSKSQKELFSLNQMMETYQNNPKFGNSKKFQAEIQNLHSHVSELESALTSIRAEHVQVEERLEALRSRTSSPSVRSSPSARLQRGGMCIFQFTKDHRTKRFWNSFEDTLKKILRISFSFVLIFFKDTVERITFFPLVKNECL